MCHLSIEKALKGLIVKKQNKVPSKVHDLIYLIDELTISVPEKYGKFVYKLNDASIPIRYPYDLNKLISVYNKDITGKIMENTKEVKEWIKQQ